MRTVYKYPLRITRTQTVAIVSGAQFLSLQVQGGVPTIWMLVDTDRPTQEVTIKMCGTGHSLENVGPYVGTAQVGPYVWHFFIEAPLVQ